MLVVIALLALGMFRGRNGGAFLLGLGLWAVARALVATTWRDPQVIGPLNMDQVISIVIASVSLVLVVRLAGSRPPAARRATADAGRRHRRGGGPGDDGEPTWPDPETAAVDLIGALRVLPAAPRRAPRP